MIPRTTRTKIGDVFTVEINQFHKRHFQYIANDQSQLNSSVIRVFSKTYNNNETLNPEQIIADNVDFYVHVFLRNGLKLGYWDKMGHALNIGKLDVLFRDSSDYGKPQIKVSEKWYIWKINGPFIDVGKLEGSNLKAEIGVVIPPDSVAHRMRTGKYDFVYPEF